MRCRRCGGYRRSGGRRLCGGHTRRIRRRGLTWNRESGGFLVFSSGFLFGGSGGLSTLLRLPLLFLGFISRGIFLVVVLQQIEKGYAFAGSLRLGRLGWMVGGRNLKTER